MPIPLTDEASWTRRHRAGRTRDDVPRPRVRHLDWELSRAFERHLAGRRGELLLEVGCGSSVWLPHVASVHGMRVVGVDYSAEGIVRARASTRARGCSESTMLVLGDAFELLEAIPPRFSCVFTLGLVEHFADPREVVAALARPLAPSGLLVTWVPNTAGWIIALSRRVDPGVGPSSCTLDLASLRELHADAGLDLVEARYTQLMDLTLVSLRRLPRPTRAWLARAARLLSLPLLSLERAGLGLRSSKLCSGILVVARRP